LEKKLVPEADDTLGERIGVTGEVGFEERGEAGKSLAAREVLRVCGVEVKLEVEEPGSD
jgi:hypothetical protein